MGYAVKNYLQEAGTATVVRVLGLAGYTTKVATVFVSGSTGDKRSEEHTSELQSH